MAAPGEHSTQASDQVPRLAALPARADASLLQCGQARLLRR
jgi:hypothetical protein